MKFDNEKLIPLDGIIDNLKKARGENLTANDILNAINKLTELHGQLSRYEELQKKKAEAIRQQEEEEKLRLAEDERISKITEMELPLDFENAFANDERAKNVEVSSSADALILSLTTLGRVDIEYMAKITNKPFTEVIDDLKGSIYQNPDTWEECFYKGWETAEEYLTGNLMRKWQSAFNANMKYKHYFDDNLKAIGDVLPNKVATNDIFVTLGSPWVPPEIIDEFIAYLMGRSYGSAVSHKIIHDELTGTWDIPYKAVYSTNAKSYSTYGTNRMRALNIIEKTLNMKPIVVTDEITTKTTKTGTKRIVNRAETLAAVEKQRKIIEVFQKWIWKDPDRKEKLETIFENNFSSYKRRRYDGSFLTFPGMSSDVSLYPYQKNAVARILFSANTLLAHDVGSGKTYVMIAAAMELKRMGLSSKNLFVVPNNIIDQWESIFKRVYPNANIFVVYPKHFTVNKQNDTLKKIRDNDYDAIIMASSSFDRIELSKNYYVDKLKQRLKELEEISKDQKKYTTGIKAEQKRVEKELYDVLNSAHNLSKIYFDELGVTRLFVDEAHNYKNVPIQTKIGCVAGISTTGSKKCEEMLDKVRYVQKTNMGGGVIFATGTPITNSITDAYVMQQYLQSGELALLDLQSFDAWVGMFAERKTEFEIDVDTSEYRLQTRFSKFHNLPELTALLSSIADFHVTKNSDELPNFKGYTDKVITRTQDFANYLKVISRRVDDVRNGNVKRIEDNMLKITNDGRHAALDLRLVDNTAKFTFQSKVACCAEVVSNIHFKTTVKRLTQLVFCDTSTPKDTFNIYDELSKLLVAYGVPKHEIAYIHDADTDKKRDELFEDMRNGKTRILIGSTFKLGLGVNVQDKLVAVHHLDVPWRPADMVQREGRIIRPGNLNDEIFIYRYITEGSFDAYSWQLLETKQNFISALLSGSLEDRSGGDVSDVVLNYAEVKALAIGNPLIKKRVETANELSRLRSLQVKLIESRESLMKELHDLPENIKTHRKLVAECELDEAFYRENRKLYSYEERKEISKQIYDAVMANVMEREERHFCYYQGFSVVLPSNMLKEKPYVLLKRSGSYYVEIGNAEIGVIMRLNNCLEGLFERLDKLKNKLATLEGQEERITEELSKEESYSDDIERIKQELADIDKKLGVNKDE